MQLDEGEAGVGGWVVCVRDRRRRSVFVLMRSAQGVGARFVAYRSGAGRQALCAGAITERDADHRRLEIARDGDWHGQST